MDWEHERLKLVPRNGTDQLANNFRESAEHECDANAESEDEH
jgi:hypothetical protein